MIQSLTEWRNLLWTVLIYETYIFVVLLLLSQLLNYIPYSSPVAAMYCYLFAVKLIMMFLQMLQSEGFLWMFYFDATSELRARETVKMPKECREMSSLLWCINCHIIYRQSYIRKSSFRSRREEKHLLVFVRMFSSLLPLWWLYGLALLVSFLLAFLEVVDLALNLESSFCNALKVVIQIRVECLNLELNAP